MTRINQLNEDITPTAEFFIPEPARSGLPTPKNLSAIRVYLRGSTTESIPINDFLLSLKNPRSEYHYDAVQIMGALDNLSNRMDFQGNLLELIFVYFPGYKGRGDQLDVVVKQGLRTPNGHSLPGPVSYDERELEDATVPRYSSLFRRKLTREQVFLLYKQLRSQGLVDPTSSQVLAALSQEPWTKIGT